MISNPDDLWKEVLLAFDRHYKSSLFTVAISGIDGSGKGYITRLLQEKLETKGYKVANINIDPGKILFRFAYRK